MLPKTKTGYENLHTVVMSFLLVALLITSSINFMSNDHHKERIEAIENASRDRLTRQAFIKWEQEFRRKNNLKAAAEVERQIQETDEGE